MSRRRFNPMSSRFVAVGLCVFLLTRLVDSQEASAPTFSVQVRRVAIDVVVKDSAGRAVKGLTQDDFRVSEDDKAQTIRSFEANIGVGEARAPMTLPQLPPNTFSDFSGETQSGPLTVLLYDLLNTPLDSQPFARAQLLQFLKTRSHTAPVAIFVLTNKAHLIQGFTDNDRALIEALNRQSNYKSAELLTSAAPPVASSGNPGQGSTIATVGTPGGPQQLVETQLSAAEQAEQEVDTILAIAQDVQVSAFLDRRVELTAGALQEIAGFLTGLPGRKNLIWFSGSFPAAVLPDHDPNPYTGTDTISRNSISPGSAAYARVRNYSGTMLETTNALSESHTAVYPVDARGVQVSTAYSMTTQTTGATTRNQDVAAISSRGQIRGNSDELNQRGAEQNTLDAIAAGTGGHAFYGTNGLADAAKKAVDDGSSYYAMTYQPTNTKTDGNLRQIKVACVKRGYTLEYRRSYFADTSVAKAAQPGGTVDPMLAAVRRGAPPAHSLFFEAHLQTLGGPRPATAQETEQLSQFAPKDASGKRAPAETKPVMMQSYAIAYGLLARQLNLSPDADNKRHATLEFANLAYSRDGTLLIGTRSKVEDAITPARYESLQQSGYQTLQRISVPVSTTTLRIGVFDPVTRLIGSTEIHLPLAKENAAR